MTATGPPRPGLLHRGPRLPVLLSALALTIAIAGIAAGHRIWSDLRSSMSRMDRTLDAARARQRETIEGLASAQALLLAQQEHLREVEEGLRARESALAAERTALEERRARLETQQSPRTLELRGQARELARRLDLALSGLSDPGGIALADEALKQTTEWATRSGLADDRDLSSALTQARGALAAAQPPNPTQLAGRIESLSARIATLPPGPPRAAIPYWRLGPAGHASAVQVGAQLQTARFALHRGDEALFRLSLDTAAAWLAALYDPAVPGVAAVRAEISDLRRLPVRRDLAGLRTELARLRAVLGDLAERTSGDGALGGT